MCAFSDSKAKYMVNMTESADDLFELMEIIKNLIKTKKYKFYVLNIKQSGYKKWLDE